MRRRGERLPFVLGGLVLAALVMVLILPAAGSRRLLQRTLMEQGDRLLAALPDEATPQQRQELIFLVRCIADASRWGEADPARVGRYSRAAREALADGRVRPEALESLLQLAAEACPMEPGDR